MALANGKAKREEQNDRRNKNEVNEKLKRCTYCNGGTILAHTTSKNDFKVVKKLINFA